MKTRFGIEVLLENKSLLKSFGRRRIGLVCHPGSVNENLQHSLDLLFPKLNVTCAFGPQHGAQGEKQDNMVESEDTQHPIYKIPMYSLYGKVRKPTAQMMDHFDVLIFDLQDIGCRIYTFLTTLLYLQQACELAGKKLIVLDRPNPAGRIIEGLSLEDGWQSFVGAASIPMRHGMTLGEMALYFKETLTPRLDLQVVKMKKYHPRRKHDFGWVPSRPWVNPSPNAANLNMARCFAGTVLFEGTHLSEGRGTTRPLELVGAPDIDILRVLDLMKKKAPQWMRGVLLRTCFFQPTFQKHSGKMCHGFQMHTDYKGFDPSLFRPYRIVALFLKCLREAYPTYEIYRDFSYEYIDGKLPFDSINGGTQLREWIENKNANVADLEKRLRKDEMRWAKFSEKFHLY